LVRILRVIIWNCKFCSEANLKFGWAKGKVTLKIKSVFNTAALVTWVVLLNHAPWWVQVLYHLLCALYCTCLVYWFSWRLCTCVPFMLVWVQEINIGETLHTTQWEGMAVGSAW